MAYGVVHTTNINGICVSLVDTVARENGEIVYTVGKLDSGEVAKVGTGDGAIACLVANPAWDYNESSVLNQNEDAYINAANVPFRGYQLSVGSIFELSADAIDGGLTGLAVDTKMGTPAAGGKLKQGLTTGVICKVLAIETKGYKIVNGVITAQQYALVRVESIA